MAGKRTSIPSFGANSGFLSFPPIAGAIFFSWIGPIGIYYLTFGNSVLSLFILFLISRLDRIPHTSIFINDEVVINKMFIGIDRINKFHNGYFIIKFKEFAVAFWI